MSSPQLGIEVVHELAGVGENLQDHLEFYFQVASRAAGDALLADEPVAQSADRLPAGC